MKVHNRWIMLVVIVLAVIAVAVDHFSYHRTESKAQGGLPLPDPEVEVGGYGSASDNREE